MLSFHHDPHRGDYEIRDSQGKCRGFIWKYAGHWVCRVDDMQAQTRDTYNDAKALAEILIDRPDISGIVTSGQYSGKIIEIENGLVKQKIGRGQEFVIHELKRLDGNVAVGQIVDILYHNGIGQPSDKSLNIER